MKKKLISTLLTCVMILGCFAGIAAQAGTTATVTVADAQAQAGETVSYDVYLSNVDLTANTLGITVTYDSDYLTYKEKSGKWKVEGDLGDASMSSYNAESRQGVLCVGGDTEDGESVDAYDFNTKIFTITFTINSEAQPDSSSDIKFEVIVKRDSNILSTSSATAKASVPHVHTFDKQIANDDTLATPATCQAAATYYYSCSCGAVGSATFTSGGLGTHSLVKHNYVAADHTKAGNIEYYTCSVCSKVFDSSDNEIEMKDTVIEQIPHVFSEYYLSDASKHWKVCDCGAVDAVEAHDFGAWEVSMPAAEGVDGLKIRYCSTCTYHETEDIPALGHDVTGKDYEHDETNHWKTCDCGEKIGVAAHRFGEWTVTLEATTEAEGTKVRVCLDCGYEETEVIPVISDNPSTGDVALISAIVVVAVALLGTAIVIGKKKAHN